MVRFLLRHGLVRIVGGRAVPAMLAWDLIMLANRTRRIPIVDRGLRRGAGAARRQVGSIVRGGTRRVQRPTPADGRAGAGQESSAPPETTDHPPS